MQGESVAGKGFRSRETAKGLGGGIRARVEGGYGDRAAGVGAQPRVSGGAHGGDRVLCSQCPADPG